MVLGVVVPPALDKPDEVGRHVLGFSIHPLFIVDSGVSDPKGIACTQNVCKLIEAKFVILPESGFWVNSERSTKAEKETSWGDTWASHDPDNYWVSGWRSFGFPKGPPDFMGLIIGWSVVLETHLDFDVWEVKGLEFLFISKLQEWC